MAGLIWLWQQPQPSTPAAAVASGGWPLHGRLHRRLRKLRAERAELVEAAPPPLPTVTVLGDAPSPLPPPRPLPDISAHERAIALIDARIAETLRAIAEEERRSRARMLRQMREDEDLLLLFF